MSQPELKSETPMSIYEVKEELKRIEKEDGELGFRAGRTKEYVETVSQLTQKKAKEVKKKLMDLDIPRFKEEYAVKIIDINPVNAEDLKQLLASLNVTVKDAQQKDILSVLQE